MIHDEIEYFRRGKSLYKTCLPEGSSAELRCAIAKSGGIERAYDRFVIYTNDKIRLDSNVDDILKKEMNIIRYYILSCSDGLVDGKKLKKIPEKDRYKKFWGTMQRKGEMLIITDVETEVKYLSGNLEVDREFYEKHHKNVF